MTDTPDLSPAALEALAERLARHSINEANELEDDLVQAAATLRALASRAEPPAEEGAKPRMEQSDNVTGLVEEARHWEAALTARADRIGEGLQRPGVVDRLAAESHYQELSTSAHLINRLAAALAAQAERIAGIELETAELVFEVEGAAQDGPMVGCEYTATGMRFTIRGALAAALAAHLAAARAALEARHD